MPQVPGTYWYHGKVPILVHMYLVRVWDVYAYHKVRVRALAMAIVRTMVPHGTMVLEYHGTCVHT